MLGHARGLPIVLRHLVPASLPRLCVQDDLAEIGLAISGEGIWEPAPSSPEVKVKLRAQGHQGDVHKSGAASLASRFCIGRAANMGRPVHAAAQLA